MRGLPIINLYKHNIVHKNIKKINQKNFILSLIMFVVITGSLLYLTRVNSYVNDLVTNANPISELYREVDYLSFVDVSSTNIIAPIKTDETTQNSNNIEFKVVASIMIYAPANGVVVGINNGHNKSIKIRHASDLYSIIENVDIIGVKVGDVVKQGKEIATAEIGSKIKLMIEYKNKIVEGIYLNKNFVKWKIAE